MNSIPLISNLQEPNERTRNESIWKQFLMRNCMFFSLLNNLEMLNSYPICNFMGNPNLFSNLNQSENFNRNFFQNQPNPTLNLAMDESFRNMPNQLNLGLMFDESILGLMHSVNTSLMEFLNYYNDIVRRNPTLGTQMIDFNQFATNNLPPQQFNLNFQGVLRQNRNSQNISSNAPMKREQINLIPTIKFKKPQSINNKSKKIKKGKEEENPSDFEPTSYQTCNICLEDYKNREVLRLLKCKHRFHKKCIDSWLTKKNRCPLCKIEI